MVIANYTTVIEFKLQSMTFSEKMGNSSCNQHNVGLSKMRSKLILTPFSLITI